MQPARAWSAKAVERTQTAWSKLRVRAHELWMKEADGRAPPAQQP
jgi:hypothetical protein